MNNDLFRENSLVGLTDEESKSINGGAPDKKTSFFYDVSYFISHKIGEAVQDGILTKEWWADWSITLIS